jgi:hypothetical protein
MINKISLGLAKKPLKVHAFTFGVKDSSIKSPNTKLVNLEPNLPIYHERFYVKLTFT